MEGGAATPESDASKILPQFFFAAAAIVIGAGVVWWNSRGGDAPTPAPAPVSAPGTSPAPAPPPAPAEPKAVTFDLLDDWRYPDGGYAIETAGLEREGYRSTSPPDAIKALDGVRIIIDGFVLPVELDAGGRITTAMLLRHQLGCGYGKAPTPSQRIAVTIGPDAELNWRTSQAASAVGVLRVNSKPEGAFPALYSMTVESLVFTTGYNPDAGLAPAPVEDK
jgi:hypothetical protein